MKSELRIGCHANDGHGAIVFEVWYNGESIASVYPTDGPGVRVVAKHHRLHIDDPRASGCAVTVRIGQ